jgi:hypothetical protein
MTSLLAASAKERERPPKEYSLEEDTITSILKIVLDAKEKEK